jgi:hypothetical protein
MPQLGMAQGPFNPRKDGNRRQIWGLTKGPEEWKSLWGFGKKIQNQMGKGQAKDQAPNLQPMMVSSETANYDPDRQRSHDGHACTVEYPMMKSSPMPQQQTGDEIQIRQACPEYDQAIEGPGSFFRREFWEPEVEQTQAHQSMSIRGSQFSPPDCLPGWMDFVTDFGNKKMRPGARSGYSPSWRPIPGRRRMSL